MARHSDNREQRQARTTQRQAGAAVVEVADQGMEGETSPGMVRFELAPCTQACEVHGRLLFSWCRDVRLKT